jgi:hypothetical protein
MRTPTQNPFAESLNIPFLDELFNDGPFHQARASLQEVVAQAAAPVMRDRPSAQNSPNGHWSTDFFSDALIGGDCSNGATR